MKTCLTEGCNNPCEPGRRYCRTCYLERRKELRAKKKELGLKTRTMYPKTCMFCGKSYEAFSKNSLFCSRDCYKANRKKEEQNPYIYDNKNYKKNLWQHRNIAEESLGRKLTTNEIVHHLDGDPKNNAKSNLVVLSRSAHGKLHVFLDRMRAVLKQFNTGNFENCWKALIDPLTTVWLETTNTKVIKIMDIG